MTKKDFEFLLRDGWRKDEDYVFVSYSSQDWAKVYPCILELRARGINVFIDIEFQENSSSNWLRNLEERLIQNDECKGIVAFVSTGYLGSYACLTELIANRTSLQSRLKEGSPLPVFYIALDEALSTPQKMSQHIYSGAVKKQLRSYAVKMESEECTTLENYLLDCHLERYPDRESIRHLLLKPIKNRFNVAATMYDLIFSDTSMMPSIQLFSGAVECAELLMRNFVNDKNESIELPILEELRQETFARLNKPAEKAPLSEPEKPKIPDGSEEPKQTQIGQLKAAAEAGDAGAQNNLGWCYQSGQGVEQDWIQAVYWYRKAAEQGDAGAQNNLGWCYQSGQGVEQDWTQAAYWYRKAAEQGDADAQFNLGVCYADAQNSLGVLYIDGTGFVQDWDQVFYWYRKAAEQGHTGAQAALDKLLRR